MNTHEPQTTEVAEATEVAVVGAGPIGLEMAVALKRAGIDYVHFEAKQIGQTISWWPRNTYFFSTSERIAIAGIPIQNDHQQRSTGEDYLAYLRFVVEELNLEVKTYEPVVNIARDGQGFLLQTQSQTGERRYRCNKLILAKGDMDMPDRLNIPGEDLPHVSHYFHDPHPYFRKRLLIIGGRNSAVEAALRCWRAGSEVTVSYRGITFNDQKVKRWILPDLMTQIHNGNVGFLPQTAPVEITPEHVVLAPTNEVGQPTDGERILQTADFVLLCTGFVANLDLLERVGVNLRGAERIPEYAPETMETNVPGLYLAGTVAAGRQNRYTLFIENSHQHVGKIMQAITGQWPEQLGTIASRWYELPYDDIQAN
jgi:thioredoxin reductase (NADPH)